MEMEGPAGFLALVLLVPEVIIVCKMGTMVDTLAEGQIITRDPIV